MNLQKKLGNILGVTLLEIILSVSIIAIIGAVTIPVFGRLDSRNDIDVGANTIGQTLRRAQVLAESSDGDTTWGLKVQTGIITVFKGADYASRDTTFDEDYDLGTSIEISGLDEVVFSKFYGEPTATGTITLTAATGETRDIVVAAKGVITY